MVLDWCREAVASENCNKHGAMNLLSENTGYSVRTNGYHVN